MCINIFAKNKKKCCVNKVLQIKSTSFFISSFLSPSSLKEPMVRSTFLSTFDILRSFELTFVWMFVRPTSRFQSHNIKQYNQHNLTNSFSRRQESYYHKLSLLCFLLPIIILLVYLSHDIMLNTSNV